MFISFLPSVSGRYVPILPKGRFELLKYKLKRKMTTTYSGLFPTENCFFVFFFPPLKTVILLSAGSDSHIGVGDRFYMSINNQE